MTLKVLYWASDFSVQATDFEPPHVEKKINIFSRKYTVFFFVSEYLLVFTGVSVRCFWLDTPSDLAHHMNMFRQNQTNGVMRRVPDVAFNIFKKNFEEPGSDEGFSEIKKIEFAPRFANKQDEELFHQWTC